MAAHPRKARRAIPARIQFALHQERSQIMLDRRPGGLRPFRAVIRVFPGDTLTPAAHAIGFHAHQQNAAAIDAPEARLKKMHERHLNFTQCYRFNFHGF